MNQREKRRCPRPTGGTAHACEGADCASHDPAVVPHTELPVLVVDAGSAITIDLIGPQGVHLGGYISPGLRLMREALWQGTAKVQVDRVESLNMLVPGTFT